MDWVNRISKNQFKCFWKSCEGPYKIFEDPINSSFSWILPFWLIQKTKKIKLWTWHRMEKEENLWKHSIQSSTFISRIKLLPIIPLIRSLAKAKFCNVFGHPISKPVWINLSDFDIIDRFLWICQNFSQYYNGSAKKKSLYQIRYILRLSYIKTLAHKHFCTVRTFLKRLGSEVEKF